MKQKISRAIEKLSRSSVIQRIWDKDASVWKKDPAIYSEIRERLGWLDAPKKAKALLSELISFSNEVKRSGFRQIVLLGMGGSSLCPEVFQKTFGNRRGCPELLVLDSTDPDRVGDIERKISLTKTLFIVSSKSGGTIELVSLFKYFFKKMETLYGKKAGERFIAITDPGTSLEALANTHHFRKIFLAWPDVGGRFSALTLFGLVPASLIGVDVKKIVDNALKMAKACAITRDLSKNPALRLGTGMAVGSKEGRDKLTILATKSLESFGDWAEQLVAESTGKEGVGVVPIVHETLRDPHFYDSDRFFVALRLKSDRDPGFQKKLKAIEKAGYPVLALEVKSIWDIGAEFFRWEMSTAIASALLGINAFDQPDVQAAKDRTKAILKELKPGSSPRLDANAVSSRSFFGGLNDGDYVGILAFLPDRADLRKELVELQTEIAGIARKAVTLGIGPRYLHSTGQLHKGGANNGVFILLTADGAKDLEIPGETYTFGQLELAQAAGDFEALRSKGRRVSHVCLSDRSAKSLEKFRKSLCRWS